MKITIRYTTHARYMMAARNVNEAEVETAIENPDRRIPEPEERDKYRFEKTMNKIKIVIAYWYKEKKEFRVKTVWKDYD